MHRRDEHRAAASGSPDSSYAVQARCRIENDSTWRDVHHAESANASRSAGLRCATSAAANRS